MNNEMMLWLAGQGIALIVGGVTAYFNISSRVSENYNRLSERLVRLETTFDVMGKNAADILHSPHDPFGLDGMLDKYIDRHYELSPQEWEVLLSRCQKIANDKSTEKIYRLVAGQLAAVCHHKLKHMPEESMKSKHLSLL